MKGDIMKIAFCQISNTLINPEPDQYAENIYSKVPGYKKGADFWEIPLWIAKASYCIPEGELYIIRDVEKAFYDLLKFDVVMFSALEVNKSIIKQICLNLPPEIKVIIGGYVEPTYFVNAGFNWFYTLQAGIEFLGSLDGRVGACFSYPTWPNNPELRK
jgi:hypothetical protein